MSFGRGLNGAKDTHDKKTGERAGVLIVPVDQKGDKEGVREAGDKNGAEKKPDKETDSLIVPVDQKGVSEAGDKNGVREAGDKKGERTRSLVVPGDKNGGDKKTGGEAGGFIVPVDQKGDKKGGDNGGGAKGGSEETGKSRQRARPPERR
ncbi:MAG: hypothetical protein MPK06_00665, partial [Alphaproteobacteria bacterium]|nr:hypothetical protein [Alphaproteobacteria bacterium]